ncbi:cell wall hydrolase [Pseudopelagicola sp. nBUS_19]|uniref:cell wall hydrolase n=1 Tax=Pseudopelagicola sp. nBUS_19 TaxID=3395316 RepID=UPI003EB9E023
MLRIVGAALSLAFLAAGTAAETPQGTIVEDQKPRKFALFDGNFLRNVFTAKSAKHAEVTYSRAWIDALPLVDKSKRDAEWQCLSEALYFEARGESVRGQFAVAEVIANRANHGSFPENICGVVKQGTASGRKYGCQFTYNCDGVKNRIHEKAAYERVGKVARLLIDGSHKDLTNGATHYHTKAVSPAWARQFPKTATIGVHHFYRMPTRVSKK